MSEWIDVNVSKPPVNSCVIVFAEDDIEFAYMASTGNFVLLESGAGISVTHWMPLPADPK